MIPALKYDKNVADKLPWDLLPIEATEGLLRVLAYGQRKYTVCGDCETEGMPTRIYSNPRLDGDPERNDCPSCSSVNILSGSHNWRKGFLYTRLISAAFRHLKAILRNEDFDPESGLYHADHLMAMVAFLNEHQKHQYGTDDRYKDPDGIGKTE